MNICQIIDYHIILHNITHLQVPEGCTQYVINLLKNQLKDCMSLSTGLATKRLYLVLERGSHSNHQTGAVSMEVYQ